MLPEPLILALPESSEGLGTGEGRDANSCRFFPWGSQQRCFLKSYLRSQPSAILLNHAAGTEWLTQSHTLPPVPWTPRERRVRVAINHPGNVPSHTGSEDCLNTGTVKTCQIHAGIQRSAVMTRRRPEKERAKRTQVSPFSHPASLRGWFP